MYVLARKRFGETIVSSLDTKTTINMPALYRAVNGFFNGLLAVATAFVKSDRIRYEDSYEFNTHS